MPGCWGCVCFFHILLRLLLEILSLSCFVRFRLSDSINDSSQQQTKTFDVAEKMWKAMQRSAVQRSAVQFDFLSGQTISTLDRNVFACFRVCVCVCVQTRVLQWRMESRKLVGCKSLVRHIPQLPVLLVCLQRPAGRRHPPIMAS